MESSHGGKYTHLLNFTIASCFLFSYHNPYFHTQAPLPNEKGDRCSLTSSKGRVDIGDHNDNKPRAEIATRRALRKGSLMPHIVNVAPQK